MNTPNPPRPLSPVCQLDLREAATAVKVLAAPRAGAHSLEVNAIACPW
jgi:hypothetical protein